MYFEFEWGSIFMLKKSINRLLFSIIIFLCFISHLLQFWTYKQLLYTKLEEMLYGFCRTWPFLAICYRAWAIGSEASPLFYCPPLINHQITLVKTRHLLLTYQKNPFWSDTFTSQGLFKALPFTFVKRELNNCLQSQRHFVWHLMTQLKQAKWWKK